MSRSGLHIDSDDLLQVVPRNVRDPGVVCKYRDGHDALDRHQFRTASHPVPKVRETMPAGFTARGFARAGRSHPQTAPRPMRSGEVKEPIWLRPGPGMSVWPSESVSVRCRGEPHGSA